MAHTESAANSAAPVSETAPAHLGKESDSGPFAAPPKPPLYKRHWFIVITATGNCLGIALLFVFLFPVVRAIIQDVVNKSTLDITTVTISNPTNASFQLSIQGTVAHTGGISAVISFPTPVNVSWVDGSTIVPLGYMRLSTLHAKNKRATIDDVTTLYIADQDAFGRFTSAMITSQNLTWQLENYDLSVQAEKFPTAQFHKLVTINVSQLFTHVLDYQSLRFLAAGKFTLQPDGSAIPWLSQGIESLKPIVQFQSAAPINPIRSINIGV